MNSYLLILTFPNFADLDLTTQQKVYGEFHKIGYRVIVKMINDHAATEDIIQDSFLKAIRNVPSVESKFQLVGWINTIVRNTTYNYIRKNKSSHIVIDMDSSLRY